MSCRVLYHGVSFVYVTVTTTTTTRNEKTSVTNVRGKKRRRKNGESSVEGTRVPVGHAKSFVFDQTKNTIAITYVG